MPIAPPSPFILTQIDRWMTGRTNGRPVQMLDLACGAGRHIRAVLKTDYADALAITAADKDAARLDQLMDSLPSLPVARVTPVCIDLEQEGLVLARGLGRDQFDIVVVTNYLHRPLLAFLFGLVSPGGLILYETFGQGNEQFGKPSNPAFLLAEGELAAALPDGFSALHHFFGQRQELYPDRPPAIICQLAARRNR